MGFLGRRANGVGFLTHPDSVGYPRSSMAETSKLSNPDRYIDCTGLFCPMPVVKTREAIGTMAVGEILEMLSDDPGSDPDMKSWARSTGHQLVDVSRRGPVYHFLIRKTR